MSDVLGSRVTSAGNKNRTLAALVSLPVLMFISMSLSLAGLADTAINSAQCSGFLSIRRGVSWSRILRSCCSNDSNDEEPDVDLPGVVTIDFSGDKLLTSMEVTPLTSVKSGSSVIPVSLSESLYFTHKSSTLQPLQKKQGVKNLHEKIEN